MQAIDRKKMFLRLGLSISVTVALVWILIENTEITADDVTGRDFHPEYLALALGGYLWVVLTRTLRFRFIHHELQGIPFRAWFQVIVIHGALNQVLPFRSGEITYPMLMNRVHGSTVGRSLLVLLVARVLDLITVFLFCLLFMPLVGESFDLPLGTGMSICGAVVVFALVALALLRPGVRFAYGILKRAAADKPETSIPARLKNRVGRLVAESAMFRDPRHFFTVFALSGAMWTGLFVVYFGLLNGTGFSIGLPATIVGSLGAVLMNVLPVNGVANVGTLEAGWTIGLVMVGFERDTAFAAGMWAHAGILSLALCFGLFGWLWMLRTRPRTSNNK